METGNKRWYHTLGWLGIAACGLCCTLPIVGAIMGIGTLTVIEAYLEKIGIILLGISGVIFILFFYQKSNKKKECSTSCDTNCVCKIDVVK